MASDWSFVPSVISAASGLLGVWMGGRLTWKRESLRDNERINKESSYLAILVIAFLYSSVGHACPHDRRGPY